jgi:hypothetical protein
VNEEKIGLYYLVVNEPDEGPSRKGVVQTQFDIYVSIAYGVCISQLIRYSEACGHYHEKDLNRIDKIG